MTKKLYNKPKFNWVDCTINFMDTWISIEHIVDRNPGREAEWYEVIRQLDLNDPHYCAGNIGDTFKTVEEAKQAVESYCQNLIVNNCEGIEFNPVHAESQAMSSIINQGFTHD
jgi:hypothetical protein